MFTGLIEKTAKIISAKKSAGGLLKILVDCGEDFAAEIGDSIAINGCCLTLTHKESDSCHFGFDISSETLGKTTLNSLVQGQMVNLERAMRLGDRLGGHLVLGHVDGTCEVKSVSPSESGWLVKILLPFEFAALVIPKGSICLDGVSLTINDLKDTALGPEIALMLIPLTLEKTALKDLRAGQRLNFEVDLVGKYILRSKQIAAQ